METTYAGPLRMGTDGEGKPLYNTEIYVVEVLAKDDSGRTSSNVGSVSIRNMSGEPLANAIMKCYTKATRLVILDHAGLGIPDESEMDSFERKPAEPVKVINVKN